MLGAVAGCSWTLRGQESKKELRTKAGMCKPRADKQEGKNSRKREEEVGKKNGNNY